MASSNSYFEGDEPQLLGASAPVVRTLCLTSLVLQMVTGVVALLVLGGWSLGITRLETVAPGLVAMNPTTAIVLFACSIGAALLFGDDKSTVPRWCAALLGAGASATGLLRLLNINKLIAFRIDAVFFLQHGAGASQMAPATAICAVLIGMSIAVLARRGAGAILIMQILAIADGSVALLAFIGYTIHSSILYGMSWYFPMALHTSAAFLMLCLSMLFMRPDDGIMRVVSSRGPAGKLARRLLPAAILFPAFSGSLRLAAERAGYFDPAIGLPLVVVANTLFFTALLWANLGLLRASDARRIKTEMERDRFFTLSLDMVSVANMKGYFLRINPAFASTLGYEPEEILSRPYLDFVHPDDKNATASEASKISGGEATLYFENRYRCKDGSYRWISWASVPVMGDGLIYSIARDMTDRRRTEQLLKDQNAELDAAARSERQARQALQETQGQLVQSEKLAALGQMVAGVAHEINNPLSFVSNNVAVLQRDTKVLSEILNWARAGLTGDPDQRAQLNRQIDDRAKEIDLTYTLQNLDDLFARSREGLRRIQQIVKDLRDFARLDEGDQDLADINDGVQSTINIIRGYARRRQITIATEPGVLPPLRCQAAKINQVIMNLLTNAIDASLDSATVTVRTEPLLDAPGGNPRGIRIHVIDAGTGISARVRERMFDPFFTTKPVGSGTGLGLSISYGIVRDHGGTISVQSAEGAGSTFTVELPSR